MANYGGDDLTSGPLQLLRQTFADTAGGGGGFGGLGGYSVSPGFAMNALPVLQRYDDTQRKRKFFDQILAGGPNAIASLTGIPTASDPTQTLLNSSLADLGNQEATKDRQLESRFSSLGRGLTSTAYSDAARSMAEMFSRGRLAANAQATQVGSQIRGRNEQLANQRLALLMQMI